MQVADLVDQLELILCLFADGSRKASIMLRFLLLEDVTINGLPGWHETLLRYP